MASRRFRSRLPNVLATIFSNHPRRSREAVAQQQKLLPPSIRMTVAQDSATGIYSMLTSLEAAVLTAVALVMIMVLSSLGLSSAILVGISIPLSFLIGFTLFGITGLTINMMVMFGLILSVGMLVDDTIIVVEYADRQMIEGAPRRAGLYRGGAAHVLAHRFIHRHHAGGVFADAVLAGCHRKIHALSAAHHDFCDVGVADCGGCVCSRAGGHIRQARARTMRESLKSVKASEHGDLADLTRLHRRLCAADRPAAAPSAKGNRGRPSRIPVIVSLSYVHFRQGAGVFYRHGIGRRHYPCVRAGQSVGPGNARSGLLRSSARCLR